jgi:hypothetical protein
MAELLRQVEIEKYRKLSYLIDNQIVLSECENVNRTAVIYFIEYNQIQALFRKPIK